MIKKHFKFALLAFAVASTVIGPFFGFASGASRSVARLTRGIHASLTANCTLYAAANGNDANSGTSPSSPKTLTGAAAATLPGSVVCLLGGRYELSSTFQPPPSISGTSTAKIAYQAYNDGPVNLVWTGGINSGPMIKIAGTYNGVSYSGPQFLTFKGLNLDGTGSAISGFQCVTSQGLHFIGNTITNTGGAGIVTDGCDYLVSDHNLINHNGYTPTGGLDNVYSRTSGISYGTVPWADTYTGIHNAITNNIVVGEVDKSSAHTDGNGIILDHAYNTNTNTPAALILNNIVYGNGGRCIETNENVTNFWIVSNTCYKNNLDLSNEPNFGGIVQILNTSMTGINGFVVNNISYSWTANNPPYQQTNPSSNPGITYSEDLYFGPTGTACSPSTLCNGFINADPQFVTCSPASSASCPPYLDPSADGQYSAARPPLPGRPIYEPTTRCAVSGTRAWMPTCDIDSGFALLSTSPAYGNIGVDPVTLTNNTNIADLRTYVYNDINGNPRGGGTGKWDLGGYQH